MPSFNNTVDPTQYEIIIQAPTKQLVRYKKGLYVRTTCENCKKDILKSGGKGFFDRDFHFCSLECVNLSQKTGALKQKKEQHFLKKYGVTNPYASKEIRARAIETCRKKYGVDNASQSDIIKEKKRKTTFEHFGVNHPLQSQVIKDKTRETCIARYGEKSYLTTKKCRDELKNWALETYGVEHHMQSVIFLEKLKQVFIEKYGVDNPLKIPGVVERIRETCIERYGVDNVFKTQKSKDNFKVWLEKRFASGETASKPEDDFYDLLLTIWTSDQIDRQYKIVANGAKDIWFIDFYIKPIETFIQFDGMFWHGLNKAFETVDLMTEKSDLIRAVVRTKEKDVRQNEWFTKKNLKLIRITDEQFLEHLDETIVLLEGLDNAFIH